MDAISPGLPPLAETWYRAMRVKDTVKHPKERFPKEPLPFRAPKELTHSSFVAEQSMEFIRRQHDRPWLCIAGFYSPHSPWVAPQEFLDLYDPSTFRLPAYPPDVDARRAGTDYTDEMLRGARHGYYAMVSEVDYHVGRMLAQLDELGVAEDTIVVFVADHGDWLGDQLRHGKGYPAPDPVSRVPLLVRWPGGLRQPGRSPAGIVEAVDVLPTLLECAGVPVPPIVQGRSLLPALQSAEFAGRDSALTEAAGWKALRTDRYRYVCESDGAEHLWDLESDPGEYADVAADARHAAALADMRHRLLVRVLENEQPLPRVWGY
jgi:arylsulfatase A-like enzyme